jgi:hypothetical protein
MGTGILWNQSVLSSIPASTPYVVLQEQAQAVKDLTEGLLTADVRVVGYRQGGKVRIHNTLQLRTPAFPAYSYDVLTVVHDAVVDDKGAVYPCEIRAEELLGQLGGGRWAASEGNLRTILQQVLNSPRVDAAVTSISARVHEKLNGRSAPEPLDVVDVVETSE